MTTTSLEYESLSSSTENDGIVTAHDRLSDSTSRPRLRSICCCCWKWRTTTSTSVMLTVAAVIVIVLMYRNTSGESKSVRGPFADEGTTNNVNGNIPRLVSWDFPGMNDTDTCMEECSARIIAQLYRHWGDDKSFDGNLSNLRFTPILYQRNYRNETVILPPYTFLASTKITYPSHPCPFDWTANAVHYLISWLRVTRPMYRPNRTLWLGFHCTPMTRPNRWKRWIGIIVHVMRCRTV